MMEKSFALSGKPPFQGYDALEDKHASFYFNSHAVKKHLRKLKKAIDMEPHHRQLEAYSLRLTQKIQQISQEGNRPDIQPYQQTLKPVSLQKLQQLQRLFTDPHPKKIHKGLPPLKEERVSEQVIKSKKVGSLLEYRSQKPPIRGTPKQSGLSKGRSNQSLQNRTKLEQRQTGIKQVKHEEFLSFLRQRQEAIRKTDEALHEPTIE